MKELRKRKRKKTYCAFKNNQTHFFKYFKIRVIAVQYFIYGKVVRTNKWSTNSQSLIGSSTSYSEALKTKSGPHGHSIGWIPRTQNHPPLSKFYLLANQKLIALLPLLFFKPGKLALYWIIFSLWRRILVSFLWWLHRWQPQLQHLLPWLHFAYQSLTLSRKHSFMSHFFYSIYSALFI